MRADMHVHTNASDGLQTPEEAVAAAKAVGLDALSVTDHDTVYNSAKVNALCKDNGIIGINGVEISAYEGITKLHTLGYGFDLNNPQLNRFLSELVGNSEKRTEEIIFKLNKIGVNLKFEDVEKERVSPLTPVHAMHLSRAAVKKGLAKHPFDFYRKYLMYGKPAFTNLCRPTPEQAIEVITAAGGIAVLAHPGRIELEKSQLRKLIDRLSEAGLKGIEAVYSTHTVEETEYFKEIAEVLGLFVTGGSDTHFQGGNRRIGEPVFHMSGELRLRLGI